MSSRECFFKWRTLTIHWIGLFPMIFVMWLWWSIPTEMGRFHHEITMVQWMIENDRWKQGDETTRWGMKQALDQLSSCFIEYSSLPMKPLFERNPPKPTEPWLLVQLYTMFAPEITCFCLGLRHHCWFCVITFVRHITVRFCCLNHPPQPNKRDSQPVDQLEGLLQVIFKMSHHLEDQQAGSNYHTSNGKLQTIGTYCVLKVCVT